MSGIAEDACPILGHDEIVDRFRTSLRRGRLGSAYLFVGPDGIGKRTFADWMAACLLCEQTPADQLAACGNCPSCLQVAACSHPDFEVITKPEDKSTIPVELLIGAAAQRSRDGLCAWIAMTPARGGRKVAIIDDADALSVEAANCLLKTLEEPPRQSMLILIGSSAQRQLPTIRSRCQVIAFRPLSSENLVPLILNQGFAATPQEAEQLAAYADGSISGAAIFADSSTREFVEEVYGELEKNDWKPLSVAKQITEYVEAAGKDAIIRRQRMMLVADIVTQLYHRALEIYVGAGTTNSHSAAQRLAGCWKFGEEALIAAVDRCLEVRRHVQANANQATCLEAWLDALWAISHCGETQDVSPNIVGI